MKTRLMVVDDSHIMEMQICELLNGSDFEVAAYCENGEAAISCYQEIQPDIVTMDIVMPGLDGLETSQIILTEHPEARIILISSMDYEDTIREAKAIGIKSLLHKPIDRGGLIEALESVLP
ncbi:MAG: response regulator [Lawsonibacter sp.]|nr:response regulator [Lawsonibacter sp.]